MVEDQVQLFWETYFIIHTASKVSVYPSWSWSKDQAQGIWPKVTLLTFAHHTGQHLIKTSQNASANFRSRWHSEAKTFIAIHPCHEPHFTHNRLNAVSRCLHAVQMKNGVIWHKALIACHITELPKPCRFLLVRGFVLTQILFNILRLFFTKPVCRNTEKTH